MHFSINYLLTAITVLLLALFPLMGGVEALETTPVVQAMGIVLLMTLFLFQKQFNFLSKTVWLVVLCAFITPLLYLIPLSADIWSQLPGHEIYAQMAEWVSGGQPSNNINRALSLIPYRTEHAFFALLPALAIFLTVAALPEKQKLFIIYFVLTVATAEACLAVIQFSSNNDLFYFGIPQLKRGIALGTYLNPDHFVLLMGIAIPLVLALVTHELKFRKTRKDDGSKSMILFIVYGIIAVLFIAAAFFSGSRAGIPLALLGGYLSYIIFMRRSGKEMMLALIILILLFIIILSIFDLTPVLNRFITQNPFIDGRWVIFSHTWDGITTFFPLGSGPGTFPDIYRIFQPIDQHGFINSAHNDYLELLFETGLIGLLFIVTFFYLFIKAWRRHKKVRQRKIHHIRIASGISLLVFLLHSLVEFNLHDVTNILYFAVLAGIFFGNVKDLKTKSRQNLST